MRAGDALDGISGALPVLAAWRRGSENGRRRRVGHASCLAGQSRNI